MSNENKKKAVLQKEIEGIVYDLMVQTEAESVEMANGKNLAEFLTEYIAEAEADVDAKIAELVGSAPEALNTLAEIAEKLAEFDQLTDEMKERLESLSNYTHPDTHSADMIEETADKKFVTDAEKTKINASARILAGTEIPADFTENDLFLKILD